MRHRITPAVVIVLADLAMLAAVLLSVRYGIG